MDKELLFRPRAATASGMPEDDVEVPGIGTVRVRGLSRAEALKAREIDGRAKGEQYILALAMIDPQLTEAEVERWQTASVAMEIEPVSDKVTELSGMADGAAKAAVKAFEADPDAEFRLPPGGEVGDAGGGSTGADE